MQREPDGQRLSIQQAIRRAGNQLGTKPVGVVTNRCIVSRALRRKLDPVGRQCICDDIGNETRIERDRNLVEGVEPARRVAFAVREQMEFAWIQETVAARLSISPSKRDGSLARTDGESMTFDVMLWQLLRL